MASIEEQLKNARTMEDIVNLLSILFTNLNNQNEQYFDMFLNPVPMDLDLERYNEKGELEVVVHPNVAKMRINAYSGVGNPNGVQAASVGALYVDTTTRNIYYKAVGSDRYGWQLVWTTANLIEGENFLSPTGNGSQLKNLNANSITSGVLPVSRGGTGATSVVGLVKGNGISSFTAAVVDEDYLAPSSLTGLVMYSPVEDIPDGWLICNGEIYSTVTRPELARLCRKLKSKYGGDGVTTFGVPNLIDRYIKGCIPTEVGETGEAHIGAHTHEVIGNTNNDGAHTHTRGTMNITGRIDPYSVGYNNDHIAVRNWAGALYGLWGNTWGMSRRETGSGITSGIGFDAARSWTGNTSATPHQHSINITTSYSGTGINDVDHTKMIPIIKW